MWLRPLDAFAKPKDFLKSILATRATDLATCTVGDQLGGLAAIGLLYILPVACTPFLEAPPPGAISRSGVDGWVGAAAYLGMDSSLAW